MLEMLARAGTSPPHRFGYATILSSDVRPIYPLRFVIRLEKIHLAFVAENLGGRLNHCYLDRPFLVETFVTVLPYNRRPAEAFQEHAHVLLRLTADRVAPTRMRVICLL